MADMPRVVVESPLAGDVENNVKYAQLCCLDCIQRGEAPYASHLIMTQFLDDTIPRQRTLGMEAGFSWGAAAEKVVVYEDRGLSNGMKDGIKRAEARGLPIEYRKLPEHLIKKMKVDV